MKVAGAIRKKTQPRTREVGKNLAELNDLGDVDIEVWRQLFDPTRTPIPQFFELFEITTETEKGFDQFIPYDWQLDALELIEGDWEAGGRSDLILPKSRRRGASRLFKTLFFERVLRVPGWRGAIIAQSDPDARAHLDSLHELDRQIPRGVLRQLGIRKVKGSSWELAYRHGRFKTSSVIVKTASARGLARGGQLNGVLQTERPHWAPKSKKDRSSFLGSCRDVPGNVVIDESSPCGYDDFYEDAVKARDGEGNAHLIFLPSHEHLLNRRRFRNAAERAKLLATLGTVKRYGENDEKEALSRVLNWRVRKFDWPEEQAHEDALLFINWRRFKIDSDCGHYKVFHREEATTFDEAFSGAGRRVFPIDIMESWVEKSKRRTARARVGKLVEIAKEGKQRVIFAPASDGPVTILEEPERGGIYCFGSDVAGGYETHADGKTEADFNTITVDEVYSGRTVATFHAHVFAKPFAFELLKLAVYFNIARGYVETNLETVVAILLEDEDLEVCGVGGEDILLTSERKVRVQGVGTTTQPTYGFKTTSKSKEYLVARTERWMAEWGELTKGVEKDSPLDWPTLEEMMRYVRRPSTSSNPLLGKSVRTVIEAESGHDDRTVSKMLACAAREELLNTGDLPIESRVNTITLPEDSTSRRYALEALRDTKMDYDPMLGSAF